MLEDYKRMKQTVDGAVNDMLDECFPYADTISISVASQQGSKQERDRDEESSSAGEEGVEDIGEQGSHSSISDEDWRE